MLVSVVLHPTNHHPIQTPVISPELVLVMLELVLLVAAHMNHHPTAPQAKQTLVDHQVMLLLLLLTAIVMVSYPKVNFKLLDIRVRLNLHFFFNTLSID